MHILRIMSAQTSLSLLDKLEYDSLTNKITQLILDIDDPTQPPIRRFRGSSQAVLFEREIHNIAKLSYYSDIPKHYIIKGLENLQTIIDNHFQLKESTNQY